MLQDFATQNSRRLLFADLELLFVLLVNRFTDGKSKGITDREYGWLSENCGAFLLDVA